MARQEGLEPPTFWFVAKHSIQLSYWRIGLFSNSLLIIAGPGRKVKPFLKFFETLSAVDHHRQAFPGGFGKDEALKGQQVPAGEQGAVRALP